MGHATMADEPITVLFVDDDEEWARFIAGELEAEDPTFETRIALNANEAIVALAEDDSIDCVVTDFRMPEVDGVQLLERIRESHPDLPCILVTGTGSEDVATRAINAGVTDYVQKDPRVDQGPILANRVRQAVERTRLRANVRASEHRYRTVIEHTRDAIVILRDDAIVFANDRFDELCGASVDTDPPSAFFEHVHEDDHERVRELLRAIRSDRDPELREVRLRGPVGSIRNCELLGDAITYESEFAILLSIRDVTRRRERERTLKRERQFKQAVQKRLVGVRTREELETEVTALLSAYGYDLAWIGDVDEEGGVHTRAAAGDVAYVRGLEDGALDGDRDHGGDPIRWSAQTGAERLVSDFEALMPTARRNAALERGFRTGYATPLRHEDIAYGTLAVYHGDPDRIDDGEHSLLAELAETVSFAIHHVETQRGLTSSRRIVVEVDLESDAYYLSQLLSARVEQSNVDVTVTGTHVVDDDAHVQYLTCSTDDSESFADALGEQPSVRAVRVIDGGDAPTYHVTVDDSTPETHLGSLGALVRSTTVGPGRATITFELPDREQLQPAVDRLNDHYGPVTVRSVRDGTRGRTRDRSARVDIDALTDKQLGALEAAYRHGYFDRPRGHAAVEIAESLGITHTTYLQHLRVAQRKLFEQLFDGVDDTAVGPE